MRMILAAGFVAVASVLVAAPSASADERRCYTLGVPGQDHYEYCTYLPIDPELR